MAFGNMLMGSSGAGETWGPVTITYRGVVSANGSTVTTLTANDIPIGSPSEHRIVFADISHDAPFLFPTMTDGNIGGVPFSSNDFHYAHMSNTSMCAWAKVPTGTSANLSFTVGVLGVPAYDIAVYTIEYSHGLKSIVTVQAEATAASSVTSLSLEEDDGAILHGRVANATSYTWTNAVEAFEVVNSGNTNSGAIVTGTAGPVSVTAATANTSAISRTFWYATFSNTEDPVTRPFVSAGGTASSSTAGVTPTLPSHEVDDILVLVCETSNQTVTTPTNWNLARAASNNGGGAAATSSTRITIFWKRAASNSETAPSIADPGDHILVYPFVVRGAINSGSPIGANDFFNSTSTGFVAQGSIDPYTLVVTVMATANDRATSAVNGYAERNHLFDGNTHYDAGTTNGNGGTLIVKSFRTANTLGGEAAIQVALVPFSNTTTQFISFIPGS